MMLGALIVLTLVVILLGCFVGLSQKRRRRKR